MERKLPEINSETRYTSHGVHLFRKLQKNSLPEISGNSNRNSPSKESVISLLPRSQCKTPARDGVQTARSRIHSTPAIRPRTVEKVWDKLG